MLTDKEILKIANDTYNDFSVDFLIECKFECVSIKKYIDLAKKTPLIQIYIEQKLYDSIKNVTVPAIVVPGEVEKIYFCKNIVNKIVKKLSKEKQKMFVRAIVLHELYHIVNRSEERDVNSYSFMKSERRAHQEFKEDYPDLYKVLEEVKKKFR